MVIRLVARIWSLTEQRIASLYAAAMWHLRQRCGLCVAYVGGSPFNIRSHAPPKNPDIAVRFIDESEAAAFCGDRGLDTNDASVRFRRGQLLVASLDAEAIAGYEWYSPRPLALVPDAVYFNFPTTFIYNSYSFTDPSYRGRALSADRWDFAHREFEKRGFRSTVYFIEAHNVLSLRASAKRKTMRWIGYFIYFRIMGQYIVWTSPGCRRLGIRLVTTAPTSLRASG